MILFEAFPNAFMEGTMSSKLLGIMAAAALLASIGVAGAKEPLKLTDHQLDKVTAGASVTQIPVALAIFSNGAGGGGGVNSFSPSTATVTQPVSNLGFNAFTVR